jgi:hypothetical protein
MILNYPRRVAGRGLIKISPKHRRFRAAWPIIEQIEGYLVEGLEGNNHNQHVS